MRDPYLILGVSPNANDNEIRAAYKALARKYSKNNAKMDEINEAYDEIVIERGGLGNTSNSSYNYNRADTNYTENSSYSAASSDLKDIREKIKCGRIEDALLLLDGIPEYRRSAEWYYLKGIAQQNRGWLEYALDNLQKACMMDPSNREYAAAKERLERSRNGGYRKETEDNKGCCCCGCDGCDMCLSLLCMDSCCECFGCDLIPGC